LVKKQDKAPEEQQSLPIAPASNPPKLGPAIPATYQPPQLTQLQEMAAVSAKPSAKNLQQSANISAALEGAGFKPSTAAPTEKVGERVQQTVSDSLATANANRNRLPMGDGAYIKKNGEWKFVPKQQFQGGFNPGTITDVSTGGFGVQEYIGGRFANDIETVVKTPFVYFKRYGGSQIAKASSKTVDAIPYTEWAENVLGKTLSVSASAGSTAWNTMVRDPLRATMTVAMAPLQIMENLVMFSPALILNEDSSIVTASDASIWEQMKGIITNTTLFQNKSTGEGYLPGGPAEEARNKLEERLRPKIYGQTATVGRTIAALGVIADVYEAGDDIHSLISGTTDMGFQVFIDPLNQVVQAPKALRALPEAVTASVESAAATRKLVKAGVALTPERIAAADEVVALVDESAQLSETAVSLVTPQPGVTWSGDQFVVQRGGQPVEQFVDIGADGPTNTANLVGPGLYDTNLSPLATTYQPASSINKSIVSQLDLGETSVPVPGAVSEVPGEAMVYEFLTPKENFLTINGEEAWTTDPNVPWNLRAATQELGFTQENLIEMDRRLVELGFDSPPNGLSLPVNSEDFFRSVSGNDTLVDTRGGLANPLAWLKSTLKLTERSKDFFTNRNLQYLLDDTLDQTPFVGWSDDLSIDSEFVWNPQTKTSDYSAVAFSSRGKAIASAIDNPSTLSDYRPTPVQALQRQIVDWEFSYNNAYATPEAKAILAQKISEAKLLEERFAAVAENFVQRKTAQFTTELAGSKLDKELFSTTVSEFRQLTQEYRSFIDELKEMSKAFQTEDLAGVDLAKIKSIPNFSSLSRETQSILAYSRITDGAFDEFVQKALYQMRVSSDFSVSIGDVGPFKGVSFNGNSFGFSDIQLASFQPDVIPYPTRTMDVVNDWFKLKGVDAISYDGGVRIGSNYGRHTARVVLSPSKLTVRASRTGEMLPTVEARRLIAEGQQLQVTAKDVAQAQGYLDAHGLIDAASKSLSPELYSLWKISGTGQNVFKAIASEGNAYEIWMKFLKGKSPRLAQKLSEATTPEEVEAIFDAARASLDPLENLAPGGLPGWSGNVIGEAGYRTKQLISKNSRMAATLPRSNVLPINDLAAGANHLHDTMIILKTPDDARSVLMNEYFRIVSQDDAAKIRGDLFDFAKEFKNVVIKDKIQPVVDRLKAPLKKTFEEMTPFERVTMKRRTELVAEIEETVRKASTFLVSREEEILRYVWDDVGKGVTLDYLEGNGMGPMYLAQQRTNDISLLPFDTDELDELLDLTSSWAEYSMLARVTPGMGQTLDVLDKAMAKAFWLQTIWKKAVLLSGRYVLRVVPEEMMRNSLSGQFGNEFGYVAEIFSGRMNKDIYGRVMPRISEADDIALKLDEALNVLPARIERAEKLGNTKLADKLRRKLDKIDVAAEQARLDEIDSILESEVASARDVMIGPSPTKAGDTALGNLVAGHIRASSQQTVFRNENPTLWLKGVAQASIDRGADVLGSAVARALQTGSRGALEKLANEMFEGSLRGPYESYFKGLGKLRPDYEWDTLDGARKYVEYVVTDLQQVTGGHPKLLGAIANNGVIVGGETFSLGRRTAYGNIPSPEFMNLLKAGDPDDLSVPIFAEWSKAPEATMVFPRVSQFDEEKSAGVFSWFMQNAYGRASDKFARVPMFNARKWNLIADMVPLLSKEEALKLKASLPDLNLPQHVIDNILDNIPRAKGTGTLEKLDNLAGYRAVEDTINLLFDSRKKTLFGYNHRLLFPFFDAFREVSVQLAKTAINPLATHKIDKAAEALGNLQIGGPGETNIIGPGDIDQDGKNEGFVYRDPQTGSLSFNYPLIGGAARALTGIPFDYKVSVGSLSMATSVIPSVGPYVALTYTAIPNRQGEVWDKLNKVFIPYGEPSNELQDYFTPLALQRFAQGLAAGTPFERVSQFLGNPNNDPVYKTLQSRTFMAELASGKYTQDEAGVREAMQASQDKGNTLWWLRGLTQFFSPGAPISQFYAEQDGKLVPLGVLLDSIRKTENDIRDKGGTFQDQIDGVVNQYGDLVLPYLASISESTVPGSESSKEFYKFKNENQDLFRRYPDVAGYFGPNTNEFDQKIYNIQKRAGELVALPKEEIAAQIEQMWGNFRYNKYDRELTQALGETPLKSYALSIMESQIKSSLPSWNRTLAFQEYNDEIVNSVNSIIKASIDPKLANLPVMAPLKEYLAQRNAIVNVITRSSGLTSVNSWRNNRGGIVEREALKIVGDQIAERNPAFQGVWDSVLSREFKTLTEQEKILAQTGQLP
jgi:hypothetical protein